MKDQHTLQYNQLPEEVIQLPIGVALVYGPSENLIQDTAHQSTFSRTMKESLSYYDELEGLDLEIRYQQTTRKELQDLCFIKRINIGSIGKNHLLAAPVNDEHAMNQLWATYADITELDSPPFTLFKPFIQSPPRLSKFFKCQPNICKPTNSEPTHRKPTINITANACMEADAAFPSSKEADDEELVELEQEKQILMDKLSALILDYVTKTKQMPPMEEINLMLKGKFILNASQLSRLVINRELKVILPDYNEMEVRLYPLPKAIYILFLRHPEGIILKNIADYRKELEEIYSIIMPKRDEELMHSSLESLLNPFSDSLQQKITTIKRAFEAVILNKELAAHYIIKGSRGHSYRIDLPQEQISIPAIFL